VFGGYDQSDLIKFMTNIRRPEVLDKPADMENAIGEADRIFWLGDEEFLRTDKISMHFGMEGRFPLLARDIVEYAKNIPSHEKLNGMTKAVVRNAYRGELPDYVVNKAKTGWYAPVVEWMSGELGNMVRDVLRPEFYPETASLFNLNFIREHYAAPGTDFGRGSLKRFWPIFVFQLWAKEFNVKLP
jgi:asparagine synthase (glutamine-hydrolysing)